MGASLKDNNNNTKPRAGSVPARSATPGAGSSTATNVVRSSNTDSRPSKRAKVMLGGGSQKTRSVSTSRAGDHDRDGERETCELIYRIPFGNCGGVMNVNDYVAEMGRSNGPTTTTTNPRKRARTPSITSLPRPKSSAAKSHPNNNNSRSVQRNTRSAGIGMGHSSVTKSQSRAVSATGMVGRETRSNARTRAGMGVGGRVTLQPQHQTQPVMMISNNRVVSRSGRRESFRPRPSVNVS